MTFLIKSLECLFNTSKNDLFTGLMRNSVPTENNFLFEKEIAIP